MATVDTVLQAQPGAGRGAGELPRRDSGHQLQKQGGNLPALETLGFAFLVSGGSYRCQLTLGVITTTTTTTSFICGFPVTPEAAPSKLAPLIPLGGCSLSARTREHRFPSPLREGTPSEIRIRCLRSWGGEGRRTPPEPCKCPPLKDEVEETICHQTPALPESPRAPRAAAVRLRGRLPGCPWPRHAGEGSPAARGKVKINIK